MVTKARRGQGVEPAKVEWQNPEQLRFVLVASKKRQIRLALGPLRNFWSAMARLGAPPR